MFNPKYTVTNTLLGNIKRIAEIVTELNSRRFPEVVKMEIARKAREISVFASTSIEGNPLLLTDVKRILKHAPEHVRDSEREVLNYNNALLELNEQIQSSSFSFDIPFLECIQKNVTNGLIQEHRRGKIRTEPVFVNDPRTRNVIFLPPDSGDVPILVTELLVFLESNETKIDPLILAGIFHKQFILVHPFVDGNGRTVRLATKVLLARMGLNTFNIFSFENYYNQNVTKYFEQVGERGNYYDIKDVLDFTSWLEYFTDGIIDELLRVKKELETEMATPDMQLETYHRAIINHVQKHGFITDEDYAKMTNRARSTRHLDFRKLIDLDILQKIGDKKGAYYKLR